MRNKAKKVLSLVLTLSMVLSLCCVSAFATPPAYTIAQDIYYSGIHSDVAAVPATDRSTILEGEVAGGWVSIDNPNYMYGASLISHQTGSLNTTGAVKYTKLANLYNSGAAYANFNLPLGIGGTSYSPNGNRVTGSVGTNFTDTSYAQGTWYQSFATYDTNTSACDVAFKVTAIHVDDGDSVTVSGGTFDIYLNDSDVTISGGTHKVYVCGYTSNDLTVSGGTVAVYKVEGDVTAKKLNSVTVNSGSVDLGGLSVTGIVDVDGGSLTSEGTATIGGGVDQDGGSVDLTGYTIDNGVDANGATSTKLTDCVVSSGTSAVYAVNVAANAATTLKNCTLNNNDATDLNTLSVAGPSAGNSTLTVEGCTINDNTNTVTISEAVDLSGVTATFTNSKIVNNTAAQNVQLSADSSIVTIDGKKGDYFINNDTTAIVATETKLTVKDTAIKVRSTKNDDDVWGVKATNTSYTLLGGLTVEDSTIDVTRAVTDDVTAPYINEHYVSHYAAAIEFAGDSKDIELTNSQISVLSTDTDDDNASEGIQHYDETGLVYGVKVNNADDITVKNSSINAITDTLYSHSSGESVCDAYGLKVEAASGDFSVTGVYGTGDDAFTVYASGASSAYGIEQSGSGDVTVSNVKVDVRAYYTAKGINVDGEEVDFIDNKVTANSSYDNYDYYYYGSNAEAIGVAIDGDAIVDGNVVCATGKSANAYGIRVADDAYLYGNDIDVNTKYYAYGVYQSSDYDELYFPANEVSEISHPTAATYDTSTEAAANNIYAYSKDYGAYGVFVNDDGALYVLNDSAITAESDGYETWAAGIYADDDSHVYIDDEDATVYAILDDDNNGEYDCSTSGIYGDKDAQVVLHNGTIAAFPNNAKAGDDKVDNGYFIGVNMENGKNSGTNISDDTDLSFLMTGGYVYSGYNGNAANEQYRVTSDAKAIVGVFATGTTEIAGGKISTYGPTTGCTPYGVELNSNHAYGTPYVWFYDGEIEMLSNNTSGVYVGEGSYFYMGEMDNAESTPEIYSGSNSQNSIGVNLPEGSESTLRSGTITTNNQNEVAVSVWGGETYIGYAAWDEENDCYTMNDDYVFTATANKGIALKVNNESQWQVYGNGVKFEGATALNVDGLSVNRNNLIGGTFVGVIQGNDNELSDLLADNRYLRNDTDSTRTYKTYTNGSYTTGNGYFVGTDTELAKGTYNVVDAEWELNNALTDASVDGYTLPCNVETRHDIWYCCDSITDTVEVNGTKTLDTNGHTFASEMKFGAGYSALTVGAGADLTVKGEGVILSKADTNGPDGDANLVYECAVFVTESGKLTAEKVAFKGTYAISTDTAATGSIKLTNVTADYLSVGKDVASTISGGEFFEVVTAKDSVYDAIGSNDMDWATYKTAPDTDYRTVAMSTNQHLTAAADTYYTVVGVSHSMTLAQKTFTVSAGDYSFSVKATVTVNGEEVTAPALTAAIKTGSVTELACVNGYVTGKASTGSATIEVTDEYGDTETLYINPNIGTSGGGAAATVVTYTITCGEGVTANKATASSGAKVTLTVAEGYENVVVTDADGKSVTVTDGKFTMPASSVKVSVSKKAAETVATFSDVADNDWFKAAVDYAAEKKMMEGVDGKFCPNASTTRAAVWTVLARLDGQTITGATWDVDAQSWAVANKISDGTNMSGNVTREELAKMLFSFASYKGYDVTASAELTNADAGSVSDWAVAGMQWAVGAKVVGGDDLGMLNPTNGATRAEFATMLMRFCEAFVK